jgi:hypothetical protein
MNLMWAITSARGRIPIIKAEDQLLDADEHGKKAGFSRILPHHEQEEPAASKKRVAA